MTPTIADTFLARPITHRGLHDVRDGRPENSLAAAHASIERGYPIELDLQLSSDGQAMVFHDYVLDRLTGEKGPVRSRTSAELAEIGLSGGDEGIPRFEDFLAFVAGRVPLLVELKSEDRMLGRDVGRLERATARALEGYKGDVALMSFNPHGVAALRDLAPAVPRGLTTESFPATDWRVPAARRTELRGIPDYDRVEASFISHEARDLGRPRVAELKAQGVVILCWTVRSHGAEARAREVADNVTFEGYLA